MKILALISTVFLVAFAAVATPIVQVRDVPNAPFVGIVAWQPGEAAFGLRTRLRRDGSHLGENRIGEHRLYLSTVYVEANGGYAHAVAHNGKLLRDITRVREAVRDTARNARRNESMRDTVVDVDACRFGNGCSTPKTVGLGISDEFLREHRDSLIVTMRPKTGRNWVIRLDGDLIKAYLATMDSVAASLKKP
jgi:hypothetical protein